MDWKEREKDLLDEICELEKELCKCRTIISGMQERVSAMAQINDSQWNIILGLRRELKGYRK